MEFAERKKAGRAARPFSPVPRAAPQRITVTRVPIFTRECIRLFFLQEDAKKPPEDIGAYCDPKSISQAAVLGAGAMGAGIALLLARKGVATRLKDIKPEFVSRGMKTVRELLRLDLDGREVLLLREGGRRQQESESGAEQLDVGAHAVIPQCVVVRADERSPSYRRVVAACQQIGRAHV